MEQAKGPYNNENAKVYHENYLHEVASQWEISQMVSYLTWYGMDPNDPSNTTGVFFQPGFGTSYGVCSWVTPFYRMPRKGMETSLLEQMKGALSGENNGLSLLLDAETFDYASGLCDLGERAGEGFKVAITHPLDMPIIQQTAVNLVPGFLNILLTND